MSSWQASVQVPTPVGAVVEAGTAVARTMKLGILSRTPTTLRCRGRLSWYGRRQYITLDVAGVDGAAEISIEAHNNGIGPLNSGACRKAGERFRSQLLASLEDSFPSGVPLEA